MNSIGKQTVISVLAGHEVPVEVLQIMLDKKPIQFGFTVQGEEKGAPDLSTIRTNDIPTLEQLVEMNTNTKAFNVHLYFGFLEGKVDERNIQPFLCVDGDDTPYLSVMVEGVFSKYNEPQSYTEELNLFDNFIYPEIENILELTDGSMDKMIKHLSSDRFNKAFLEHVDHRAVLHILPLEGDPITNFKNELGETYPWGYMSQRHGYGDAAQEPEIKKVDTAKKGWWQKKGSAVAKVTAEKPPVLKEETKTSVPEVKPKQDEKKRDKAVRPPSFIHSNGDIKAWYTAVTGVVPGNWKKRLPAIVKHEVPEWKDLKEFQAWVTSQKVGATSTNKTETAVLPKNAETLHLPKDAEKQVSAGTGVILNKKELEGALDYVSKYLDGQSAEIPDPKTIQSMETKVPTLSESLAFDATSYLNWPRAALMKFFHEHPTAAALAFIEVRDMLRPHIKVTAEVKKAVAEDKVEEEKVVTTTTKSGEGTVHTSSKVVPNKGSWWKKKAA